MAGKIPFLLEIGTEEIPARFFPAAIPALRDLAARSFEKSNIEYDEVRCMASPRRLAVMAVFTSPVQRTTVSEIPGPPARAAFDGEGRPTKAAEGFARAQGVKVSDLIIKETPKGPYVIAVKKIKGRKIAKVLPGVVPEIIRSLHFPKAMRWGSHTVRFVRPIRWIACLLGTSVVNFDIDGIKSGRHTFGHRLLSPKKISLKSPREYERVLVRHHVIVDHEKRNHSIRSAIEKIEKKSGTRRIADEELLTTVTFLVEEPGGVLCEFPKEYLALPSELLITVMKDHQKYFALKDGKGKMAPFFIVISNTAGRNARAVRAGAERVIKARFEDARFYYTEDIKQSLSDRREILQGITFHEKLGTVLDKVRRIETIAAAVCERIVPALKEQVALAARLCKSDLTTGVVREFPELQGVTGYYYALREGLPADIAIAIREHYKPVTMTDRPPASDIGNIVSIADKMDSVAAFFSAGITPTGSEDPFALRRQAQGVVQILLSAAYPLTIRDLIEIAGGALGNNGTDFTPALMLFYLQRVEFALLSAGIPEDVIRSLLGRTADTPLAEITDRANALIRMKHEKEFTRFLTAVKRVRNILPDEGGFAVDRTLLRHESEIALVGSTGIVAESFRKALHSGDVAAAVTSLLAVTAPVNAFFDGVMVMDRDATIRNNRLAILRSVWNTVNEACDFTELAES